MISDQCLPLTETRERHGGKGIYTLVIYDIKKVQQRQITPNCSNTNMHKFTQTECRASDPISLPSYVNSAACTSNLLMYRVHNYHPLLQALGVTPTEVQFAAQCDLTPPEQSNTLTSSLGT